MIILSFHQQLEILNNLTRIIQIFHITIFAYGSFHKIKEDDNINENTKEGTVIKDVRVSPYALKRKHLVELLIIMRYIPLCTNVENVLTIILELNKNDAYHIMKRDYHMQKMQPFTTIADYETYTNKLNQTKPYSFLMLTHCIFNESNNKLTFSQVKIAWMNFFDHLIQHANHTIKTKLKLNPHSNTNVYQSNLENTICLICSNKILTNSSHAC